MSGAADSPQVRLRDVKTLFLECEFFHSYYRDQIRMPPLTEEDKILRNIYGNGCCEKCHSYPQKAGLIYIRPFKVEYPGDTNCDWSLHIEAIVCCRLHDFVRSLPRQFWVDELKRSGHMLDEGYNYSQSAIGFDLSNDDRDSRWNKRPKKGQTSKKKEDEEPSFDDFMNR